MTDDPIAAAWAEMVGTRRAAEDFRMTTCPNCQHEFTRKKTGSQVISSFSVSICMLAGYVWAFMVVRPWPLRAWFGLQVLVIVLYGLFQVARVNLGKND